MIKITKDRNHPLNKKVELYLHILATIFLDNRV